MQFSDEIRLAHDEIRLAHDVNGNLVFQYSGWTGRGWSFSISIGKGGVGFFNIARIPFFMDRKIEPGKTFQENPDDVWVFNELSKHQGEDHASLGWMDIVRNAIDSMPDKNENLQPGKGEIEINGNKVPVDRVDLEIGDGLSGDLAGLSLNPADSDDFVDVDEFDGCPDDVFDDMDDDDIEDDNQENREAFLVSSKEHEATDLASIWSMLKTPIYIVTEGDHGRTGRIRHIDGDYWIYREDEPTPDVPQYETRSDLDLDESCSCIRYELDPNQEP